MTATCWYKEIRTDRMLEAAENAWNLNEFDQFGHDGHSLPMGAELGCWVVDMLASPSGFMLHLCLNS